MLANMRFLALLLWIITGVHAAVNLRNDTIACVFREYAACYRDIPTLGANFTAKYDDTVAEVTATCRAEYKVQQCILNVAPICRSLPMVDITNRINYFIHNICTNKTSEQINFLNSSVCYNKYYYKRYDCVNKYGAGKSTDAKSLCCSNLKTLRCLEEDLRSVCPRNNTEFQGRLVETYRSYGSFACGPYLRHCSTAPRILSACGVLATTLLSIIVQRMQKH